MARYVATVNVPGYLPMDGEPAVFDTAREAWQYLVDEIDRSWDEYPEDENGACLEVHTQLHNKNQDAPGVIYGPTPGYEGEHDLGLAYSVSVVEPGGSFCLTCGQDMSEVHTDGAHEPNYV